MAERTRILFLYSEVMTYTISSIRALVRDHNAEVYMVRWDKKKLTPYTPPSIAGVMYYLRSEYSDAQLFELAKMIDPDLCYVSGWMDKGYLKVAAYLRKRGTPVVAGLDNQWEGTPKQRIACLLSPYKIKPYFSHFLAAGIYQYEYARRLGYPKEKILLHEYSADVPLFEKAFYNREKINKKILFVGRFHPVKGIDLLYDSFSELEQEGTQWNLVMIGNGPLKTEFKETPKIKIKDFMSPEELVAEAETASIFCLPSNREPWGVVIHEFAAAGLALITSDSCGAGTSFVKHGYNGFLFRNGSKQQLKQQLSTLMNASEETLSLMGKRSHALAQQITPELWASNILSVLTH